jgi:hypothetical protein
MTDDVPSKKTTTIEIGVIERPAYVRTPASSPKWIEANREVTNYRLPRKRALPHCNSGFVLVISSLQEDLDRSLLVLTSCGLSSIYLLRSLLPKMNPRELVNYIRSGPKTLLLDFPLRFRRRTRSDPCDFNEFLQALQSSETIRATKCRSHVELSVTEDQWVLLVKALGSIKGIEDLSHHYTCASRDFRP